MAANNSTEFHDPARRRFVTKVAATAAAIAGGAAATPLAAQPLVGHRLLSSEPSAPWDMSWVDRLAGAPYRVVFDATTIADGAALDLAADFIQQFHTVYDVPDTATRAVIVMRQLAASLAFNDALWRKYKIGEQSKVTDPATKLPALRNPFLRATPGAPDYEVAASLERLHDRAAIFLVCNRAAMNAAARLAEAAGADVETVRAEVRGGLVPGAVLMPDGIFALIRAQNAGCAYMRGS
jgi:hypothetical protein